MFQSVVKMDSDLQGRVVKWVEQVLEERSLENVHLEFPNYDPRGGYAAEMIFVDVTGEINGKKEILNLIIKRSKDSCTADNDPMNLRLFYGNEVNVYSKFVPYLREFAKRKNVTPFDNIPFCYGTVSTDKEQVIVLENLKLKGFKVHDLDEPLDSKHAKLALEAYGKWHALWFALRDQDPQSFEKLGKCNVSFTGTKMFDCFVNTVQKEIASVIEIYKEMNRTTVVEKLKKLKGTFGEMLENCFLHADDRYLVMRHGDCWNNNFLFHYNEGEMDPSKVVIIDWQVAFIGSPLPDVINFLFYCCSRAVLEHLDDLLSHYYEAFSKRMRELGSDPKKCFPREAFLNSLEKYVQVGIAAIPMIAKVSYKVDTGEVYDITKAAQDGDLCGIFEGQLKDPNAYFDRINEIVEFSIERGFL